MKGSQCVLVLSELLAEVVPAATTRYEFMPGTSGLPQLDAHATLYGMYRILSAVRVVYKASCGSTTGGLIVAGCDYKSQDSVSTLQGTASLEPKCSTAPWKNAFFHIPANRAMKQKWLETFSKRAAIEPAFVIQITSTSTELTGSLWVEYAVEFVSPSYSPTTASIVIPSRLVHVWPDVVGILPTPDSEYENFATAFKYPFPVTPGSTDHVYLAYNSRLFMEGGAVFLTAIGTSTYVWTEDSPAAICQNEEETRLAVSITEAEYKAPLDGSLEWLSTSDWGAHKSTGSFDSPTWGVYFSHSLSSLISALSLVK